MSDPNRRTMGPEEPTGRGLRLGLLVAGLAIVVLGVVVIAGPIFGRRRPPE